MNQISLNAVLRLLLAVLLGGVIGFERAERGREAGLRTHIFVCLGSCLVMLISEYVSIQLGLTIDITRMGAQVISGIGFLGVGCIISGGGDKIKGLTTAAGLWVTACIGLAIGIGYYFISVMTVVIMTFVMIFITPISTRILASKGKLIFFIKLSSNDAFDAVKEKLEYQIKSIDGVEKNASNETLRYTITLSPMKPDRVSELVCELGAIDGVIEVIHKNH